MASELLNTLYTVLVLLVALGGLAVVLSAGDSGEGSSTRMGVTAAAVALFVIGLVASTLGYI